MFFLVLKNVGISHIFYNEQMFLLESETKHMSVNRGVIKWGGLNSPGRDLPFRGYSENVLENDLFLPRYRANRGHIRWVYSFSELLQLFPW